MSSGYKLTYHKEAVKFIAKQEKAIQERIVQGLKGLLNIPPAGDIKPMKGYVGLISLPNRYVSCSLRDQPQRESDLHSSY